MGKFKWAFVGSGGIAHTVARQLLRSNRHEIVGVVSRNKDNAARFAERFGGASYGLDDTSDAFCNADGVYVCTVNTAHLAGAEAAIAAGKAVLVEKPFASTEEQSKRLFAAAAQKGSYIAEAMWTWYNPVALKVKQWVTDGRIGIPQSATINFELNLLAFKKLRARLLKEDGGGALYDLGIYPIAYFCRLFGVPDSVESTRLRASDKGVDLAEDIVLRFGSLVCRARIAIDRLRGEKAVIIGTDGSITIPTFHVAKKTILKTSSGKEVYRYAGDYVAQFDAVASEIRAGKIVSDIYPPEATLTAMRVIDTVRGIWSRQ